MPAVLTEVKARDRSAQISGYLFTHKSRTKRWKRRWYVVYNLVLYEFVRHEVGVCRCVWVLHVCRCVCGCCVGVYVGAV